MLIRFFKSSYPLQYISLLGLGAVLWFPAFMFQEPVLIEREMVNPLFNLVQNWLEAIPWLLVLVAFILVLTESLLLNSILIMHDLIPRNSLLPAVVFMVLMSSDPLALTLYPALLAIFFCIILISVIFFLYGKQEVISDMLTLGLLVSVASLFYFSSLFLIFLILISLSIYRIFGGREWSIPFIGLFLPYAYLFTWYFWTDQTALQIMEYQHYFSNLFHITFGSNIFSIAILGGILLLLLIPAMTSILSSINSYNISFRKKMWVNTWFTIIGIFMIFASGNIGYNRVILIPATIFIAHQFSIRRRTLWHELVFLAFIIAIGINNYLSY